MDLITYEFLDVCKDVTSKYSKIQKNEYLSEGLYAIVDQGKELISGYTNNQKLTNTDNKEVVIFGDHTRILKFIDVPIAIGADGVKVLQVDQEKADSRFIYYYLKSLRIQDAGYSRHYKFLKRKTLIVPKSITAQKQIAKLLSDCEQLIQWRKESIQLLDDYLESTFLEMFGDPRVKSDVHKYGAIKDLLGEVVTGNTPPRKDPLSYGDHLEWIKTDNLSKKSKKITKAVECLSEEGEKKARVVESGSLLVTCIAGSLNSIGTCGVTDRKISFNQQINAIVPFDKVESEFIYWMFKISKSYIQQHAKKGMKKILTKGMFEKIMFIKPEHELQLKFSEISNRIAEVKLESYESLNYLEDLYYSISQKAFKGELNLT